MRKKERRKKDEDEKTRLMGKSKYFYLHNYYV
jgi:hypothetical protein